MKLPKVRFTVRGVMIAVAAVGLLMGVWREGPILLQRRADYSERARSFTFLAEQDRGLLRDTPYILRGLTDSAADREYRAYLEAGMLELRARADYLRAMGRKYERAARFPWLPVAPDPN